MKEESCRGDTEESVSAVKIVCDEEETPLFGNTLIYVA